MVENQFGARPRGGQSTAIFCVEELSNIAFGITMIRATQKKPKPILLSDESLQVGLNLLRFNVRSVHKA